MAESDAPFEGLLIDGKRIAATSDMRAPVMNPATGEVLAHVAQAGVADADAAVAAARSSYEGGAWRRATAGERARVLLLLAELIRANVEELARLQSRNGGKAVGEARGEIG